jgi:uncharacterized membrane protein YphA (DoxX/SURF4 family)
MDTRIRNAAFVMRVALGLTATLAGLDKFFNILADWTSYISPVAMQMLPMPAAAFMSIVGIVELAVGVAVLFFAPRIGAYVACAWLLLVSVNLVLGGHFDIAVRDVVMAISAYALARLVEVEDEVSVPAGARRPVTA